MGERKIADPRKFELAVVVESSDIDQLGHVNNVTYLRWVQDIAVAHWTAAASKEDQDKLLWIVLRHEIDYRSPAFAGDKLIVRTWVGDATRLKFERHTEITRESDGRTLAKALTLWCPIDVHSGSPVEVSAEVRASFSTNCPLKQ